MNSDSFTSYSLLLGFGIGLWLWGFFLWFSLWRFVGNSWRLSVSSSRLLLRLLVSSLLFLKEFREKFFIGNVSILGFGPVVLLSLGIELLSSKSLLSNESLDPCRFIENFFDFLLSDFDLLLDLS